MACSTKSALTRCRTRGYDTVEANHQLGFAADERDFTLCADMFKLLGVDAVRLLTNNPKKVEILTEAGINIVERVPLIVGRNPKMNIIWTPKPPRWDICWANNRCHRLSKSLLSQAFCILIQHITNHVVQNAVVLVIR